MSHGEFYAIGAFAEYSAATGLNFWVMLALVPILMVPLGVLTERYLVRRVYGGRDRHVTTLLLTFGLALIIEDVLKLIFDPIRIGPRTRCPALPTSSVSSCRTIVCS